MKGATTHYLCTVPLVSLSNDSALNCTIDVLFFFYFCLTSQTCLVRPGFFFWCATLAETTRKSRHGVSFVCLQEIEPPQTSGTERFWTSAPLPLSIGSLADHKPVSRMPAKQVIQELNLHIHRVGGEKCVAAGRQSQRKARSEPKGRPKCFAKWYFTFTVSEGRFSLHCERTEETLWLHQLREAKPELYNSALSSSRTAERGAAA